MDKNTFINLYKSRVRPHLEYANLVWSPYKKGDISPGISPGVAAPDAIITTS